LGMAPTSYSIDSDMLQSALRRLDSMLAAWNAAGIRIGYPLPGNPGESDIDDDSSIPDAANETVFLNLAVRIAPSLGKTVTEDTKRSAAESYRALSNKSAMPIPERQFPGELPLGAGNKPAMLSRVFVSPPDESNDIDAGSDGDIIFE
jgi:hypothetical protein